MDRGTEDDLAILIIALLGLAVVICIAIIMPSSQGQEPIPLPTSPTTTFRAP